MSAAARVLFISQPGVSLHLSSLENYVGHRLFQRDTRKLIPTERATILYNFIAGAMSRMEEAEKAFHRKIKKEKPTISVGLGIEMFRYALEDNVPGLPFGLNISFGDCRKLSQQLHNGMADLILTSQADRGDDIIYQPFFQSQLVPVCGTRSDTETLARYQLAGDLNAVQKHLAARTWYSPSADMDDINNLWLANFSSLPSFKPHLILPCFEAIMRCLGNGNGIALMPDFVCRPYLAEGLIKLVGQGLDPVTNTYYFGYRKSSLYHEEITQLQEAIKQRSGPFELKAIYSCATSAV